MDLSSRVSGSVSQSGAEIVFYIEAKITLNFIQNLEKNDDFLQKYFENIQTHFHKFSSKIN